MFRRYYEARLLRKRFTNVASFRSSCCPNVPLEAIVKLVVIRLDITPLRQNPYLATKENILCAYYVFIYSHSKSVINNFQINVVRWRAPGIMFLLGSCQRALLTFAPLVRQQFSRSYMNNFIDPGTRIKPPAGWMHKNKRHFQHTNYHRL